MVNTAFNGDNTHADYAKFLGHSGSRKLANNTYAWQNKSDIVISLHNNAIIVYHADGSVSIDTCGYRTTTTKQRLNQFSPFNVYQKNWEWYANGELMRGQTAELPAPRHWYSNHGVPGYLPDSGASDYGEYRQDSEAIEAIKDSYEQLFDDATITWYEPENPFVYALQGIVQNTPEHTDYEIYAWREGLELAK